jgi:hypothetical protein
MITATANYMRDLLTGGQDAVRAVEERGSQHTGEALFAALCSLPLLDMDDRAYCRVQTAIREVAKVEDSPVWALLDSASFAVAVWVDDQGADGAADAALTMVMRLAVHCSYACTGGRLGDLEDKAWKRAHLAGLTAVRAMAGAASGSDFRTFDKAMSEFSAAVRRAVPYVALYTARTALEEFARTYGVPVDQA